MASGRETCASEENTYMKNIILYTIVITGLLISCNQSGKAVFITNKDSTKTILIDTIIKDSALKHIQFLSSQLYSYFKTPVIAYFFSDDQLVDSIIDPEYEMDSWYSIRNDTIGMVSHLGGFETEALFIRFVKGTPSVYYLRAPHENFKFFRLHQTDSLSIQVEVEPLHYKLQLSEIPDKERKQVIYGFIDMESDNYYNNRYGKETKERSKFRFYFRSQYRNFE